MNEVLLKKLAELNLELDSLREDLDAVDSNNFRKANYLVEKIKEKSLEAESIKRSIRFLQSSQILVTA